MAGCADPRRLVHADADVQLLTDLRLARVQPHPDEELHTVGPRVGCEVALRIHRSRDRVLRAPERDEEGVSLRVDLVAAMRRERLAQDSLVLLEHVPVLAADPLQERGRPLDIGEEERDGAARERGHIPKRALARATTPRAPSSPAAGGSLP